MSEYGEKQMRVSQAGAGDGKMALVEKFARHLQTLATQEAECKSYIVEKGR